MKVKFNSLQEFLDELAKDAGTVHRRVVRVTNRYQIDTRIPTLRHVSFIASYICEGSLVELDKPLGSFWQDDDKAKESVKTLADETLGSVELAVKELRLELRNGVYEEKKP